MISPRFRVQWPKIAAKLRSISDDTLSEPLGETAMGMAMACAQWRYDAGTLFLQALQARERAPRLADWEEIIDCFRKRIAKDALKLPPAELPDEVLASPKTVQTARAAA